MKIKFGSVGRICLWISLLCVNLVRDGDGEMILCFGIFILLKFNICGVIWCDLLMLAVGSILGVDLECAC